MKGIIGAGRAKTFTPSSYGGGDSGGSAGGYGVHGTAGPAGPGMHGNMPSMGYGGAMISFEGGVRGGGVSELETRPSQEVFHPKRNGYDEHRSTGRGHGTIHGKPGVEGMEETSPHGASNACTHCGFTAKSAHGLMRHGMSKHGSSYAKGHRDVGHAGESKVGETRGETEGPDAWEMNQHEWDAAKAIAAQHSTEPSGSSSDYSRGDSHGIHGVSEKWVRERTEDAAVRAKPSRLIDATRTAQRRSSETVDSPHGRKRQIQKSALQNELASRKGESPQRAWTVRKAAMKKEVVVSRSGEVTHIPRMPGTRR